LIASAIEPEILLAYAAGAAPIFAKASVDAESEDGVIDLGDKQVVSAFIEQAKQHRVWGRELFDPDTGIAMGPA
jgi:hypothetical protein